MPHEVATLLKFYRSLPWFYLFDSTPNGIFPRKPQDSGLVTVDHLGGALLGDKPSSGSANEPPS